MSDQTHGIVYATMVGLTGFCAIHWGVLVRRTRLDRTARTAVLLLFLAWTVDFTDRFLVNLALPNIGAEFGLDHTQQGLVLSAFFLAYAAFQIPGGLLADRFGAMRVMSVAILAWSVFTALTGAVGSFAMLIVVRLVFGAAEGLFPGASIKALSERTDPAHRMTANGWMQSSGALAVVLAPLVGAPLITAWGWRVAFFAVAGLGLLVWVALRRWLPAPRALDGDVEPTQARHGDKRAVLLSPTMWGFALMFFGYDVILWGLSSWVPSYLQTERGLSVTAAGALTVLPAALAGIAFVVGGRWSDRLAGRHRVIIVPAMVCAAVCLGVMAYAGSLVLFVVMLTAATMFTAVCTMPIFAVPLRTVPPRLAGVTAGMLVFGGQAAGVVAPLVMGALVDAFSYRAAFLFLVSGALLTTTFALCTPQNADRLTRVLGLPRPGPAVEPV